MSTSRLPKILWQSLIAVLVVVLLWVLWKALFVAQSTTIVENQQGRAFPNFSLTTIKDDKKTVTLKDLEGKPHLVHIFASWCGVCIDEHAAWMTISQKSKYPIVGVAYRDEADLVKAMLEKKGDPFVYVLNDVDGKLGIELGLVGVPETYVLDAKGNIRLHQLGAIDLAEYEAEFAPVLAKLGKEA